MQYHIPLRMIVPGFYSPGQACVVIDSRDTYTGLPGVP